MFIHLCKLMVSNWSLSNSMFPQVSRTLLSILDDLNNAVVCMVSTHPFISKSSSPYTNPFVIVSSAPTTSGTTVTFVFHSCFFLVLYQSLGTYPSFRFLLFSLCGLPERQSRLFGRLSVFFLLKLDLVVWLRLGDPFVSQNPRDCFIFLNGLWVVHIPIVCMVKYKFLAQFTVNYLSHPVVSSLILFCVNLLQ